MSSSATGPLATFPGVNSPAPSPALVPTEKPLVIPAWAIALLVIIVLLLLGLGVGFMMSSSGST